MTMSVDDLRLTRVPSVNVGLRIRRPPAAVFEALVDPAITTRFWFTKSSGRLEPGARVRWEWAMYGVSTEVVVEEVEPNRRIRVQWGDPDDRTTVGFRLVPVDDDAQVTYVHVTESGLTGDGDRIVARVADSTAGFSKVLCALKALLEHDVVLTVVADLLPPEGFEA